MQTRLVIKITGALTILSALSAAAQPAEAPQETRLAIEELRSFTRVFEQIRQAYVEDINDEQLFEMAIWGMLQELDPHSAYLTLEARNELRDAADGQFSGIGIELSMEGDNLTVITPIDGSPAARAGIEAGDIIVQVDGISIQGMTMRQALVELEGEAGQPVTLTIARPGERGLRDIPLQRERIAVETVTSRVVAENVGYIRISQFSENTPREFSDAVTALTEDRPWLAGIIVDLRNNPGGLLRSAVGLADSMLSSGPIVSTRGRLEEANQIYRADEQELVPDLPLVILINRGTASAAEIVAGTWQDRERALIVGDVSFGKGSVQEILSISETAAIKLTVARYYTPSGRSIQAQGIYPDIRIDGGRINWDSLSSGPTEAQLSRALDNDTNPGAPEFIGLRETLSDIEDAQLSHAVGLLQGNQLLRR